MSAASVKRKRESLDDRDRTERVTKVIRVTLYSGTGTRTTALASSGTESSTMAESAPKPSSWQPGKDSAQAAKQPASKDDCNDQWRQDGTQQQEQQTRLLARIASSDRTAFERRVWSLLLQIPPGCFSTYGILSAHLASSPRAVGNALRRNPFAPEVPCHRIVATGGGLGGFKGKVARRDGEGITLDEKRSLLRSEGVRLDPPGARVLGTPWSGFV